MFELNPIHPLIRSNSLEVKCVECDNIFRNKARLARHYETSHVHICETCYEWEETSYRGDAEIAKHNYLVHETQDKTLTDQEFEDLSNNYEREIVNGPDTPKRENLVQRIEERKRKKDESEKKDMKERRQKRLEEQRRKEEEEGNLKT